MERNVYILIIAVIATGWIAPLSSCVTASASAAGENIFIDKSNIRGGFIVHAGCGDGTLVAALGEDKKYVIQGLESNRQQIEKARHTIRATGDYGRLSIKHWRGDELPYAENLVNLLIIDDGNTTIPASEIERVLAPRGMAIIHKECPLFGLDTRPFSREYLAYTKPIPEEIDDWRHYLYAANNNAVSRDRAVAPPQQMQWVYGPAYAPFEKKR